MGTPKDTLYFWGKGVCKQKTGDCRLRRLTGQERSIRRVAIAVNGHLVIKPTQDTLRHFKRELIKISIQFVCKLQSIIFPYTKVNHAIFSHRILLYLYLYLYLLKHTYYILYTIARVSFWQFDKNHHFKRGFCLTNRKIRIFCPVCSNFEIIIVED